MTTHIQLIVGLANPGAEYAATRHNAGAWWIESLAENARITLKLEAKLFGLSGMATIDNHAVRLLIPTTFMNESGRAVAAAMRYFKIPPDAILIAHDELDLPVGAVRLKDGGGAGGHNGLRSIIENIQTPNFIRLRIGIGHPPHKEAVTPYVLSAPARDDKISIVAALTRATMVLPEVLEGKLQLAMTALHSAE
jgi:PTH1 family peptidyl-tRNA hydrolase